MGKRLLFIMLACLILLRCTGREAVPADAQAEIRESSRYIALTFDDGPKRETTTKLLDGLRERGASATFFLVGEQIEENRDLVERMKREGHQVGNHTWDHARLEGSSAEVLLREVNRTDEALRNILGEGSYWLRPPYGFLGEEEAKQLEVPLVKWSVDPRDWESRSTKKVVQAVLETVKPNDIVLLHDIYPTSVEAALQIVDDLQGKGYSFVTVEELLRLNGITPQPGTMYRSGTG